MASFWNRRSLKLSSESGLSLVESLVTISLLSIAMAGITAMLIMSIRTQDKITTEFRSQLDVRKVLYDMELQVSEAKRTDTLNNQPIFQADSLTVPTQQGSWVTYEFATPVGESSPTIIRRYSATRPATLPVTPVSTDHKLIDVGQSELETTVERVSPDAPIFTYYGADGTQIAAPVSNPRSVRSIKVAFLVTESKGHSDRESTVSSTQINLRNY